LELGRRLGPQWAVELDMHDDRSVPGMHGVT